jgi:ABC-2 type transport system permease protein
MLSKEFILVLRDKHALAALFIMPSIFILIMSMALKDTFAENSGFIRYAIIDHDNSTISAELSQSLRDKEPFQESRISSDNDAGIREALNHDLRFVLSIPAGFAQQIESQAADTVLRLHVASDAKQATVSLVTGEISASVTEIRLQAMFDQLETMLPGISKKAEQGMANPRGVIEIHYNGLEPKQQPSSTQQSVPSWIVFGMFFIIIPMSTIFINERKQNTLMRMTSMNISIPALFAGKIIPYMVINQIQVWLMIGVGMYIVPLLGADALTLGNSVPALLMVSMGLSIAAIGTSILIAVSVQTVEQATTIGGIINILFGAIGGIMVPKFYMPQSMQTLSNISPMSWGLEGFLDVFLRGLGARAVVTESLALAGFGLLLLCLAWIIFAYRR